MPKYKIVCKACNTVHGHADKPIIEGLSAKCATCGLDRIAIERESQEIYSQMDFDLFIANKGNGQSTHHGFIMGLEDLNGKSDEEIKNIFIDRAAKTLAAIIDNNENIAKLLDNGKK